MKPLLDKVAYTLVTMSKAHLYYFDQIDASRRSDPHLARISVERGGARNLRSRVRDFGLDDSVPSIDKVAHHTRA